METDFQAAPMQACVFLPNWIGDVAMSTPALRALRRHVGAGTLVGVMRPGVAGVLEGTNFLDETLLYDPAARGGELSSWSLVRELRQRRFDLAVLMTNSFRTGLLAWLGGAKERVGYASHGRGLLLTLPLAAPPLRGKDVTVPAVQYYLELAYRLGCPQESPRLELATLPDDEQAADVIWHRFALRRHRTVVLNCSGAFGAAKLWPPDYFADLARRVAEHLDHDVLVLCGPKERDVAAGIAKNAAHPRVASLAEAPLSVGLSKACVRRSKLMVSTDSGPRHFAVAFGVPLVTFYGPTSPMPGLNPTARETALHAQLDCLFCYERACPLSHHRCMRDITPDRVFGIVAAQLAAQQETTAA
ncbi:MAG: lipopolysaccharide heptosyltransferase II [Planctomycetia bacterium]|nr:lipopolysaccharide heptosyltransferase II [Planctomycetia bacterium]